MTLVDLETIVKRIEQDYYKTIIIGKIIWSENGWCGWDHLSYESIKIGINKGIIKDRFVKNTFYGLE
ncbi:MAG: hypothetical protein ACTSVV_03825, partial [Promethearchaeota archaeon]